MHALIPKLDTCYSILGNRTTGCIYIVLFEVKYMYMNLRQGSLPSIIHSLIHRVMSDHQQRHPNE